MTADTIEQALSYVFLAGIAVLVISLVIEARPYAVRWFRLWMDRDRRYLAMAISMETVGFLLGFSILYSLSIIWSLNPFDHPITFTLLALSSAFPSMIIRKLRG